MEMYDPLYYSSGGKKGTNPLLLWWNLILFPATVQCDTAEKHQSLF